jgi:hypothetical protein
LEKVATFGILNVSELKTMTDLEISKIDGISEKETKEIVKSLKK